MTNGRRLPRLRGGLRRCVLLALFVCASAVTLAGCGAQTSTPPASHTFKGTLTVTPIGAPCSLPGTIAATSDGSIWFPAFAYGNFGTGQPSGAIGRLSPAGALTFFPLPAANAYPWQIAVGPDGNLWFTIQTSKGDDAVCGVGRITAQGSVKTYSPANLFIAGDITPGPDQGVWFASGSYIVRAGRDGKTSEYVLPKDGFAPMSAGGITAGGDGALWFATNAASVGRIAPDGTIKLFPFPQTLQFDTVSSSLEPRELKGITTAPDRTLWLTDDYQIGHFV